MNIGEKQKEIRVVPLQIPIPRRDFETEPAREVPVEEPDTVTTGE